MDPSAEPRSDRPLRVLIEHPSSLVRLELTEQLRAAGHDVITCSGPRAPSPRTCPLLAEQRCALLDAADLVVNGLHAAQDEVFEQQRRQAPDTPVLLMCGAEVVIEPDDLVRPPDLSPGPGAATD